MSKEDQKNTGELFTLVFTLNEGVRLGYYPVLPGNVTVVDTEHKYVPTAVINGAVLLEEPTVTSSSADIPTMNEFMAPKQ